uniref:Uncharacterized protein n=1 Tax=uncultured marine group II/III euryarchaeote AD1000_49_G12 TaxID=1457780 RepID=A0A075FSH0_9EURY|nr:hypothetical protein [uncultured marine group II/III euryarchaeote AD1000_49_G12]
MVLGPSSPSPLIAERSFSLSINASLRSNLWVSPPPMWIAHLSSNPHSVLRVAATRMVRPASAHLVLFVAIPESLPSRFSRILSSRSTSSATPRSVATTSPLATGPPSTGPHCIEHSGKCLSSNLSATGRPHRIPAALAVIFASTNPPGPSPPPCSSATIASTHLSMESRNRGVGSPPDHSRSERS